MEKPTHLDWEGTNGVVEPSSGKKATGWASAEKPAFQYANWINKMCDEWHKYLDFFTLKEGAYNVGCVLSGGTFKLVQANGDDFTTDNPGFIVIKSQVSPGLKKILQITAATHLFVDDVGSSDIAGEEFGTTAGVAWGNERPFFLYAINRNDSSEGLAFAISPCPSATSSPVTANIGYHGNPMSTPSDKGFFFLTETNVTATHNEKACLAIGSLRMTKTSSDDWTVATLTNADGISCFQEKSWFDMPTGQMGASSGKHFDDGGGAAPTYGSVSFAKYRPNLDGTVSIDAVFRNTSGGTAGSGSASLAFGMPYKNFYETFERFGLISGYCVNSGAVQAHVFGETGVESSIMNFVYQSTIKTATTTILNSDQNQTTRILIFNGKYKAF